MADITFSIEVTASAVLDSLASVLSNKQNTYNPPAPSVENFIDFTSITDAQPSVVFPSVPSGTNEIRVYLDNAFAHSYVTDISSGIHIRQFPTSIANGTYSFNYSLRTGPFETNRSPVVSLTFAVASVSASVPASIPASVSGEGGEAASVNAFFIDERTLVAHYTFREQACTEFMTSTRLINQITTSASTDMLLVGASISTWSSISGILSSIGVDGLRINVNQAGGGFLVSIPASTRTQMVSSGWAIAMVLTADGGNIQNLDMVFRPSVFISYNGSNDELHFTRSSKFNGFIRSIFPDSPTFEANDVRLVFFGMEDPKDMQTFFAYRNNTFRPFQTSSGDTFPPFWFSDFSTNEYRISADPEGFIPTVMNFVAQPSVAFATESGGRNTYNGRDYFDIAYFASIEGRVSTIHTKLYTWFLEEYVSPFVQGPDIALLRTDLELFSGLTSAQQDDLILGILDLKDDQYVSVSSGNKIAAVTDLWSGARWTATGSVHLRNVADLQNRAFPKFAQFLDDGVLTLASAPTSTSTLAVMWAGFTRPFQPDQTLITAGTNKVVYDNSYDDTQAHYDKRTVVVNGTSIAPSSWWTGYVPGGLETVHYVGTDGKLRAENFVVDAGASTNLLAKVNRGDSILVGNTSAGDGPFAGGIQAAVILKRPPTNNEAAVIHKWMRNEWTLYDSTPPDALSGIVGYAADFAQEVPLNCPQPSDVSAIISVNFALTKDTEIIVGSSIPGHPTGATFDYVWRTPLSAFQNTYQRDFTSVGSLFTSSIGGWTRVYLDDDFNASSSPMFGNINFNVHVVPMTYHTDPTATVCIGPTSSGAGGGNTGTAQFLVGLTPSNPDTGDIDPWFPDQDHIFPIPRTAQAIFQNIKFASYPIASGNDPVNDVRIQAGNATFISCEFVGTPQAVQATTPDVVGSLFFQSCTFSDCGYDGFKHPIYAGALRMILKDVVVTSTYIAHHVKVSRSMNATHFASTILADFNGGKRNGGQWGNNTIQRSQAPVDLNWFGPTVFSNTIIQAGGPANDIGGSKVPGNDTIIMGRPVFEGGADRSSPNAMLVIDKCFFDYGDADSQTDTLGRNLIRADAYEYTYQNSVESRTSEFVHPEDIKVVNSYFRGLFGNPQDEGGAILRFDGSATFFNTDPTSVGYPGWIQSNVLFLDNPTDGFNEASVADFRLNASAAGVYNLGPTSTVLTRFKEVASAAGWAPTIYTIRSGVSGRTYVPSVVAFISVLP